MHWRQWWCRVSSLQRHKEDNLKCSKQWCQPFLYQSRLFGRRVSRETEHLSKLHKMFLQDFLTESAEVCTELTAYNQCDMTAFGSGASHHNFDVSWRRWWLHQDVFGNGISPYNKHICWNVYRREATNEVLLVREKQRSGHFSNDMHNKTCSLFKQCAWLQKEVKKLN